MKKDKKKDNTFPCEVCGNPLIRSSRYQKIRCVYCKSLVDVPGFKEKSKKEDKE